LDLHHELRQAGIGLIQVHQLFGGKEAHVPVQPASPRPRWLMVDRASHEAARRPRSCPEAPGRDLASGMPTVLRLLRFGTCAPQNGA